MVWTWCSEPLCISFSASPAPTAGILGPVRCTWALLWDCSQGCGCCMFNRHESERLRGPREEAGAGAAGMLVWVMLRIAQPIWSSLPSARAQLIPAFQLLTGTLSRTFSKGRRDLSVGRLTLGHVSSLWTFAAGRMNVRSWALSSVRLWLVRKIWSPKHDVD